MSGNPFDDYCREHGIQAAEEMASAFAAFLHEASGGTWDGQVSQVAPVAACAIDWPAFGLADPDDGVPCPESAMVVLTEGCVHEHVARSLACYGHLAEMLSYETDPAEWICGPCAALGHMCPAPLGITELGTGSRLPGRA